LKPDFLIFVFARGRRGFRQQAGFGHSRQRVHLQDHEFAIRPHDDVDPPVITPADRAKSAQRR
jgi:hypothetical protein